MTAFPRDLFDLIPSPPPMKLHRFDGATFEEDRDGERLSGQLHQVRALMADGAWRTLGEIVAAIGGGSEAGVSARLRDLRKPKFGGFNVERRYRDRGVWEYRVKGGTDAGRVQAGG